MNSYVQTSKSNFSLSPQERRQRQEIMEAMQTVQSALDLLSKRHDDLSADLKSHKIMISSQQCMAKLHSYVEQTLNP